MGMKLIDADAKITALLYDEEHEETKRVEMTIADFLDSHTEEGCPQNGGWISVKSELPEINEPVLFTGKNDIGNRYPAQKGYYGGDEWYTFGGLWDKPLDRVTHWMPLPESPRGNNK